MEPEAIFNKHMLQILNMGSPLCVCGGGVLCWWEKHQKNKALWLFSTKYLFHLLSTVASRVTLAEAVLQNCHRNGRCSKNTSRSVCGSWITDTADVTLRHFFIPKCPCLNQLFLWERKRIGHTFMSNIYLANTHRFLRRQKNNIFWALCTLSNYYEYELATGHWNIGNNISKIWTRNYLWQQP